MFQEKRLRDQGTDATRSEQPGHRGDQVDNKNGQIAHRRIVAGWEILRNHGRNNNSPGTAYELETVRLTITVHRKDGVAKPLRFSIESPAEVEVQGTKERQVEDSESWFLLPKEQGEYVVVVRGLAEARPFAFEQHLSVRRLDGFTRRQFVVGTVVGTIVGIIGTVIAWFKGGTKKPNAR